GEFSRLTAEEVQRRCASPLFGEGIFARRTATLHPGKLALGLRSTLLDRGVRIHECTPAHSIASTGSGVEVITAQGSVRAGSGVLACGVATADWPGLRRETTMTSSHMVITEPVPDILDSLGWRGGEAIIDGRTLVHYFRTTSDERIAFGWGGGMIGRGVRPGRSESMDLGLVSKVAADLQGFFPAIEGRTLEHAWGGPIDASPTHMPAVRPVGSGRWHAAFGYTGNGVGPSRSCGLLLAQRAVDPGSDPGVLAPLIVTDPLRVPPEPLRWLGGSAIMKAIDKVERAGSEGGGAGPLARAAASLPERLGYSIGR
ncbi:MAG: FAD-dependent oxidoreductase, partial [Actinomycetes bacterium]